MLPKRNPKEVREKDHRVHHEIMMRQLRGQPIFVLDALNLRYADATEALPDLLSELMQDATALNIPSIRESVMDKVITMGKALVELERFKQETLGNSSEAGKYVSDVQSKDAIKAIHTRALPVLSSITSSLYDIMKEADDHIEKIKEEAFAVERRRRRLEEHLPVEAYTLAEEPEVVPKDHAVRIEELRELMWKADSEPERELIATLISFFEDRHAVSEQRDDILGIWEFKDIIEKSSIALEITQIFPGNAPKAIICKAPSKLG